MADSVRSSQIMVKQSSKKNSHQDGSSVKMLINEMCNRENPKHDRPSVVAQLMGMNTLTQKIGPTTDANECFDENSIQHASKASRCEGTKVDLSSIPSTAEKLPSNCKQKYFIPSTRSLSSTKPYNIDHPQEQQLQIFKKEFEAWQESKLWEFSSNLGHCSSEEPNNEQIFALENLNKEKMAVYTNACLTQKNYVETDDYVSVNKHKISQNHLHGLLHDGNFGKQLLPKTEDDMAVRIELAANSFETASSAKFQDKKSAPCSPTRIVILKPNSDINDEMEETWGGSPEVVKKVTSMEDFLEEVKERLRLEMEGKGSNDSMRRLSVGHTSLHESSANLKQQAREAAKHGAMLRRSQSVITYRNALPFDGHESSKSIKRETKKFISDRLKIVLKDDTEMKPMLDDGMARKSFSVKEKARSKSITASSKEGKDASFWEDKKAVNESIPKHLRHEQVKLVRLGDEAMSPSNLDISFSASASGSAFKKALLEDHRVATEDPNFQKHEASQNDPAVIKKGKKDSFSIKSTVSKLRRNLGLRAKFFGRKVSLLRESTVDTVHYVKPDETPPSFIRNCGIIQDNSTEVPPSPASFPCSPAKEHHSPVSPLEDPFVDDQSSTQVSGELSVSLTEFGCQTEDVERERCAQLYGSNETILIEGCGEAYVRDILVVSGLYRASWPLDHAICRLDGQVKPISSCVFDQVEEKCRILRNVDDDYSTVRLGDIDIDRKMLFGLVNEALPSVLDAPKTQLMSKRLTHCLTQLPYGRKLLDELLNQIQIYANLKVDQPQSIDKMVVWDLNLMHWLTASHEDISFLGREVESVIVSELIDELLSDLLV